VRRGTPARLAADGQRAAVALEAMAALTRRSRGFVVDAIVAACLLEA
jgi:hypothetical protein